jgi:hypothetical protein
MLAVLANLLYVYASLPELVTVQEEGVELVQVNRETLFYIAMVVIALVNVLVYVFSSKIMPDELSRTWLHGLVITLNIFIIISLSYISLYNSAEQYDFSKIGFIIYGSLCLVVLWAVSLPVYKFGKKIIAKEAV